MPYGPIENPEGCSRPMVDLAADFTDLVFVGPSRSIVCSSVPQACEQPPSTEQTVVRLIDLP